jgi:hypothetical protein
MEKVTALLIEIIVAIVAALATSVFASWEFWRRKKAELEQEYLKKFNEKKWGVYTDFTKLLQDFLADKSDNFHGWEQQPSEISLASQLVLIGSDEVVKSFRAWREASMVYGKSQKETKEKLFMLVATMRNDLGIKYSKLEVDDLLGALEPQVGKS